MHAPHLCAHSHYSFRWGVAGPEALAEAAAARGIDALALTDVNGVYGAVPFYHAAKAQGIKPLIGARLAEGPTVPGCVVLARDFPGYQALCRLVSAYRPGEGDWQAIAAEAAPHLFFLAGSRAWLDALDGGAVRAAGSLYARRVPADLCRSRDERLARERLARYARARGIPLAASGDVTFVDTEAHTAHRVLAAMGAGTTLARLHPQSHAPATAILRDADHLRAAFADDREAFANACRIASRCIDDVLAPALGTLRHPPAPLPAGTEPVEELRRRCRRGLSWRYGDVVPLEAGQRLDHELTVIDGTGYASYFLVAADVVARARAHGVPTLGRGSAAGSLVAYLLGLTAVDPLKYGLSFERFMAFERANPPDIDLDFPWDSREGLLAELFAAYGEQRVAMVGAFTTFEARGLVQEIGATLGMTRDELARLSKRLPRVPLAELPKALAERPTGLDLHPEREPLATILRVGRHLDGAPKGLSMHPCGLVIAPDRVADWVPVERSAQGWRTTQFSMDPVEEVGLIKFDLIGNRALGVVRDTVTAVAERHGETVDFDAFDPSEDPAARALMAEGRTLGCFYVESPSSRQILQRLDCRDFETAVAATSIIRPGVSHAGVLEHYVARHRGEEAVDYPHPALRQVLAGTYGVLIYQEQLLAVMEAFAGIPPGEADQVRRSLTKKGSHWQPLTAFEDRFREGARARGHDEGSIDRVWRQIASFAGYSFCKSHSAAFIVAAWQGAYLKAHYPAEYLAALIGNGGGFYSLQAYISEARRLGLAVHPPHVNASGAAPRAEAGAAVRLGLHQVKAVGADAVADLVAERRADAPFAGLADLARRVPTLDRAALEALVGAGALDGLGPSRRALLWELETEDRRYAATGTGDLFAGQGDTPVPAVAEAESVPERLQWELRHLGAVVGGHPFDLFPEAMGPWEGRVVPAAAVADHAGERIRVVGWHVTSKSARTRTDGRPMSFLTLEDRTDLIEGVLFPDAYRRFGALLHEFGPFMAAGKVQREQGVCTLAIERLDRISQVPQDAGLGARTGKA